MANPTVFVSSTFYDLRYVREGVKRFIEALGYLPVLSEDGTVFYDPKATAAEACLGQVAMPTSSFSSSGVGMAVPCPQAISP